MDWLPLVTQVLTPLLGSTAGLITDLVGGAKSLAVARAELAGILSVANTRLNDMDRLFAERDRINDARVAALPGVITKTDEPTKP